ncbi:Centriolin [Gossypium australe]|uniref:Centriolin n=1 Tax=Gossypium australe TaxID=47621 RepID=A0A5B6W5E9_9ROSI|nr:Centriolin [Gossypium australe]
MAARSGGSSFVQPLHPPSPKSPPKYPDLYGKRRERAKVQMLEREISFLEVEVTNPLGWWSLPLDPHINLEDYVLGFTFEQEELKSIEGFQPASRYCKEVTDFVMANSDPLIQLKKQKSCGFWKWLWYQFLVLFSVIHIPENYILSPKAWLHVYMDYPALTWRAPAVASAGNVVYVTAARATACPANAAPHLIAMHVNAVRATAALVTAVHVLAAAKFQNGSAAAERCRAVAIFDPFHAQTAVLASGNAIVLNVQSYAIASVVQKPVVTHVANCSKMSFNFLQGIN